MRRWPVLAVSLVVLGAAAGCGGGGASTSTDASKDGGTAEEGGTVVIAIQQPVTGLPSAQLSDQYLGDVAFEGLTKPGQDTFEPQPSLATSWKSSPDRKVWTFNLRKGVKWQDGEPFTAADVKFTFDAWKSGTFLAPSVSALGSLERTEIVNDHVVRLHYANPEGNAPLALTYNAFIWPKHLLEDQDLAKPVEFMKKPIGTGPFQYVKTEGDTTTLERNPTWWNGRAKLDQIQFKVVEDPAASIAQLQTGELDVTLIPLNQVAGLEGSDTVRTQTPDALLTHLVSMRVTTDPYQDVRVRQALNYAVDKEAMLDAVLQGLGTVADGPLPLSVTNEPTGVPPYPYDPDKAAQLLDEAGWRLQDGVRMRDGKPMRITLTATAGIPDTPQMAEVIQQAFNKLGIQTDIQLVSRTEQYLGLLQDRFNTGVEYIPLQPDGNLVSLFSCEGTNNRSDLCSKKVDRLIAAANAAGTPEARAAAYRDLQQALRDAAPSIWLNYPNEAQAISRRLQGFPNQPLVVALNQMGTVSVSE